MTDPVHDEAAARPDDPRRADQAKEWVRTTCPRDCYDACGIVVVKRGGRITKVLGDPQHPVSRGSLCGKCALAYNGAWLDPLQRLTQPLRRSGPKGSGAYAPVSWDTALREIAQRTQAAIAARGAASVLHTHYTGTCSLIAGNFPLRFFNRIGATEVDPDSVCNRAGHEALRHMFGSSFLGFDPRSARDTQCLVIWGANPSATAPHAHRHWIPGIARHAKVIVIDPVRHPTAEQAHLHLQPFPGTDAALAFALLHALQALGAIDQAFIDARVSGWERLEQRDDAALPLSACTPEWAEGVTGVPAALIREAARCYAQGPAMLWLGQGLQRQPQAGNVMRACALLPVATGNFAKPGSGLFFMNSAPARGVDMDWLNGVGLRQAPAPFLSHMDLAGRLEDPARASVLFTWNNNIAASSPEQARLRAALRRDDLLHVALDLFPTDTTACADYVLPAASFLEFDDLVMSYFDYSVSAQVKASEPMAQSLPNQEIFRRLAQAMGLSEPALRESDASLIAALLAQVGLPHSFEALAAAGTLPWCEQPFIPFAEAGFPTASGKVEICAAAFAEAGLATAPHGTADARPAAGWLRVLSPADTWLMNSSYANDARIAERLGPQKAWLHPAQAAELGLQEGQAIRLVNETGALALQAALSDRLPRGVVLVYKGRWPSREGAGNVNLLNPARKTDLAQSSSVHGIQVRVERA